MTAPQLLVIRLPNRSDADVDAHVLQVLQQLLNILLLHALLAPLLLLLLLLLLLQAGSIQQLLGQAQVSEHPWHTCGCSRDYLASAGAQVSS